MDALSDVLRTIRLTGGVFLDARFSAPWSILSRVLPEDCRDFIAQPARIISYHFMAAGEALLRVGNDVPVKVRAGQIIILPRNDPHTFASELSTIPIDAHRLIQAPAANGLPYIEHGGGGAQTHMLCGFLGSAAAVDPLTATLPPLLILDVRESACAEWLMHSFRMGAGALGSASSGSALVLSKLAEMLFAEAIRRYADDLPAAATGWLAGLRDPVVGRSLAILHTRLNEAWTTERLAAEVALSRSAFAERFTATIGLPPMRYLANWRVQSAAHALTSERVSIAEAAYEVGYESEAAFTRAFKRVFGLPPAAWRRQSANASIAIQAGHPPAPRLAAYG